MIVDNTLVFSDSQAITATAASTNIIDLTATGTPAGRGAIALIRDIGMGDADIEVAVEVTQAFNNLTSLKVSVEVATDAAFTTPVEVASKTYLLAALTLGALLPFPAEIPEGANLRFLRLNFTVVGTAPTTGKVFASVVAGRPANYY